GADDDDEGDEGDDDDETGAATIDIGTSGEMPTSPAKVFTMRRARRCAGGASAFPSASLPAHPNVAGGLPSPVSSRTTVPMALSSSENAGAFSFSAKTRTVHDDTSSGGIATVISAVVALAMRTPRRLVLTSRSFSVRLCLSGAHDTDD